MKNITKPFLRLYYVDSLYANFLRQHGDSNLLYHNIAQYNLNRVYVGPFNLDGNEFYAPISSVKPDRDYERIAGYITPRRSSNATHRIVNDHNIVVEKIKFSHMIPVPREFIKSFNIADLPFEPGYLDKMHYVASYIKRNAIEMGICASNIYSKKIHNPDHPRILDIPKLVELAGVYKEAFYRNKYIESSTDLETNNVDQEVEVDR